MKTILLALVAALAPVPAKPIQVQDVVQVRQIPETRISPDGKHVAFVVTEPSVAANKVTYRLMVDTRTLLTLDRITDPQWSGDQITFLAALDGADEVWSVPVSGGRPRKLFAGPGAAVEIGGQRLAFRTATTPLHDAKVLRHQWSHDGRKVAFVVPQLVTPSTLVYDEKAMGVQSITSGQYGTAKAGIWVYQNGLKHLFDLDLGAQGGAGPGVTWSPDDSRLELDFSRKTTVIDARSGQVLTTPPTGRPQPPILTTTDTLTAWSFAGDKAAAVSENATTPPRVVRVDGSDIQEVFNPNRDVPPVQAPVTAQWTDVHGHMMEAAVKSSVDDGTVDPAKVGIAGYSRGAEVTQLAISHSTVFKAASSGEGGNGTVAYWLLGAQNPYAAEQAEEIFGGSPVDPAAVAKWRAYAADLRADHIIAPLLMQGAENTSIANMELRAYIRARNVPAELTIFPGEAHVFQTPGNRAVAMTQNLDWFDYWLTGRRDPDPGKKDQYARWDAMRP